MSDAVVSVPSHRRGKLVMAAVVLDLIIVTVAWFLGGLNYPGDYQKFFDDSITVSRSGYVKEGKS